MFISALIVAFSDEGPTISPPPNQYFVIRVVDEETGRPVPLVELKTVNGIRYYTDSSGVAAFYEPGLMNRKVFFHLSSPGYEFPKDGFGYRGVSLETKPGDVVTLKIKRLQIAQRLYRITGQGIYNYSLLAGLPVPIKNPVLNGLVMGQDSVQNAVFKGRIYWFWGDTQRPGYPLGNFHVPGATSLPTDKGGLDPELGIELEYFVDKRGFAKETCHMPGPGPTWIDGLTVLRDERGDERMFASYSKIKPGTLEAYERGIVEWDDDSLSFRKVKKLPLESRLRPSGHPFIARSREGKFIYFAIPFALVRVPAAVEPFLDPSKYEAFTPLIPDSDPKEGHIERDERGRAVWGWKRGAQPVTPVELSKLVKEGGLSADEVPIQLRDRDTGSGVLTHSGSIYWNGYRRRYVMIAVQIFGSSMLGEVWYSEADTPIGPWCYAVKVATHSKYSFYNPKQDPMFDKEGGKVIFFEGTYSTFLSGLRVATPRYDYNQLMYKLDLGDPRLAVPVPVYDISPDMKGGEFSVRLPSSLDRLGSRISFWAPDRPFSGCVAVVRDGKRLNVVPPEEGGRKVVFYALPEGKAGREHIVPLFEYRREGSFRYSTNPNESWPGYERSEKPICYVWKSVYDTSLLDGPLMEYVR